VSVLLLRDRKAALEGKQSIPWYSAGPKGTALYRTTDEQRALIDSVGANLLDSSSTNPLCHLDQVGERFSLHLVEQMAAVQLDGNLAEV
jgi:hypothetical protein